MCAVSSHTVNGLDKIERNYILTTPHPHRVHRRTNTHRSAAQHISPASFAKTSTHFLTFKNKSRAAEQQSFVEFQAERTAQHTGSATALPAARQHGSDVMRTSYTRSDPTGQTSKSTTMHTQHQSTPTTLALCTHSLSHGNETERSLLGALAYSLSLTLSCALRSRCCLHTQKFAPSNLV